MGDFFDQIPDGLKEHIREITKSSGLDDNEESLEMMAQSWIDKKEVFENSISEQEMSEVENFEQTDERGALVLTYSGSLLNLGPKVDDKRNVDYTSIGIRIDVPDSVNGDDAELAKDIAVDGEVEFAKGPIKNTSAVYKIAVPKEELSVEEQEEVLNNATVMISDEFVKINQTIVADSDSGSDSGADSGEGTDA